MFEDAFLFNAGIEFWQPMFDRVPLHSETFSFGHVLVARPSSDLGPDLWEQLMSLKLGCVPQRALETHLSLKSSSMKGAHSSIFDDGARNMFFYHCPCQWVFRCWFLGMSLSCEFR